MDSWENNLILVLYDSSDSQRVDSNDEPTVATKEAALMADIAVSATTFPACRRGVFAVDEVNDEVEEEEFDREGVPGGVHGDDDNDIDNNEVVSDEDGDLDEAFSVGFNSVHD